MARDILTGCDDKRRKARLLTSRSFLACRGGMASVEFALTFSLLVVMVLVVAETGRFLFFNSLLQHAVTRVAYENQVLERSLLEISGDL